MGSRLRCGLLRGSRYPRPSGARYLPSNVPSMSSVERLAGSGEQVAARQPPRGTTSLVLGAVAVTMMGCPLLPGSVSMWLRFTPIYFIFPVGICAVVAGAAALRRMRGQEGANRFRARAGTALGTVAVVVPLAVVVWAIWALSQTYR